MHSDRMRFCCRWAFAAFLCLHISCTLAQLPPRPTCPDTSAITETRNTTLTLSGVGPHRISGLRVSSSSGACILLSNADNVLIENSIIGPCKAAGVQLYKSTNVTISFNKIFEAETAVHALESSGITVERNLLLNSQGPFPRGQCFQSDKCRSPLAIRRNWCEQVINLSDPEDNINLYKTNGTSSLPVLVEDNVVYGGGPSNSGCGVLVGDNGGMHQIVRRNTLVNPGQCGIGVASGEFIQVLDNIVFSSNFTWTNTGIYVWNQYPTPCNNITVTKNSINWKRADGQQNDMWDGKNCGTISGWEANKRRAAIVPANISVPDPVDPCMRGSTTSSTSTTSLDQPSAASRTAAIVTLVGIFAGGRFML